MAVVLLLGHILSGCEQEESNCIVGEWIRSDVGNDCGIQDRRNFSSDGVFTYRLNNCNTCQDGAVWAYTMEATFTVEEDRLIVNRQRWKACNEAWIADSSDVHSDGFTCGGNTLRIFTAIDTLVYTRQ